VAWLSGSGGRLPRHKLHVARFRRLIEAVRRLVELHDDAKEKLAGQWVIDRGYVASFRHRALELGRELIFDSGVLADEDQQEVYAAFDRARAGLAAVLARREDSVQPIPQVFPLKQAAEARGAPICDRVRFLAEVARELGVPVPQGLVIAGLEGGVSEAARRAITEASAELAESGAGGTFSLYPCCSGSGEMVWPEEWGQALFGIPPQDIAEACETLLSQLTLAAAQPPSAPSGSCARSGRLCVSCLLEQTARERGVLVTSDPDRPLSLRLEVLSGSARGTYAAERFPRGRGSPEKRPPADAIPLDYGPLVRVALAIERFAGRPQALAWTRGNLGFEVLQCADIVFPSAEGPAGPRLAEALRKSERVFHAVSSIAVAGVAAGNVCRLPSSAPPGGEGGPSVLVLTKDQTDLPVSELRQAAAVLTATGGSELPWLPAARQARTPVLTGLGDATQRLQEGEPVTIDAQEGIVYRGITKELLLYHLVEPTCYQAEPAYRLLRSAVAWVAPASSPSLTWAAATTDEAPRLRDVLFLAHERALKSFESLRHGWWGRSGVRLEGSGFPGSLRIVDVGAGTAPPRKREWFPRLAFERIRSEPFRVLLEPLAASRGERSLQRGTAPTALAVLTEESASVDIEWPEAMIVVDACLGDHAATNSVYCAFRSPRRAEAPEPLRRAFRESGFRLLDVGTGLTGWVVGRVREETEHALRRLGRALVEILGSSPGETGAKPGGRRL
jgi:phosphohistidine swiveling domain-containing protein